jgi:hypothetical protein
MENEKLDKETADKNLYLELGQVIELIAPADGKIHQKLFLIEYLDENLIKLINENDYSIFEININNGKLLNETIEQINIIPPSPTEKGYARQWGYLPNKWFKFHFGGDDEQIIHGKITNLEKDQIEIKTYPDEELIYIDFAYKGIPLDLPLIKITPREPPTTKNEEESLDSDEDIDIPDFDDEGEAIETYFDRDIIQTELNEQLLNLEDLEFDNFDTNEQGELIEEKEVSEEYKRYNIESQTDDLLQKLLSSIPTKNRNDKVLNGIHKQIERFKELRILYSIFNDKGYANKKKINYNRDGYNTTIEQLKKLNKNLHWIIPITKTKRKIYDLELLQTDNKYIKNSSTGLSLHEENEIFEEYKKNSISNQENKYSFYFKNTLPFYNPNILITDENIFLNRVNNSIESISDTIGDLQSYSIGIDCKETINYDKRPLLREEKFVSNKFIQGLTQFELYDLKQFNFIGKRKELTSNEMIPITGYMVLPETIRDYSRVYGTNINIQDKATLNLFPLQKWKLFEQIKNNQESYIVDVKKNRSSQFKATRESKNKYKIYKKSLSRNLQDMQQDMDNNFLQSIIPTTVESLNNLQEKLQFNIKNKIKFGLSIKTVIDYLEPNNIYFKNINYDIYSNIERIVDENIEWYKKTSRINVLTYNDYVKTNKTWKINALMDILKNYIQTTHISIDDLIELYNLNEYGDEFLKNIVSTDSGSLFMDLLTLSNINLFQNINIQERINKAIEDSEKISQEFEQDETQNNCKTVSKNVLAKRYVDIDELKEDDDEDIYFDKKYDDTRYGIMDMFKADKDILSASELMKKISIHLINNVGVSVEKADRDALAMLEKKKKVIDGDFAILDIGDFDYKYYIRKNNKWRIDESLNGKTLDDITFCNIEDKCININKECTSIDSGKNIIKKKFLRQISEKFDEDLNQSMEDIKKNIEISIKDNIKMIKKKIEIKRLYDMKYDIYKNHLGELLSIDDIEVPQTYRYALKILSDSNMVSKYRNILLFIDQFCRDPYFGLSDPENIYWFYDKNISYPILPTFYEDLANAFFNGNYETTLKKICDERGSTSADGGHIIDKHSGYIIRNKSFSEQEGYSADGFKIVTKSTLEADFNIDDAMNIKIKDDTFKFKTENARIIQRVIVSLDENLSVSTKNSHKFIIKVVNEILSESNTSQNEKSHKRKRKKETETKMMYLIFGLYLISLQTNIPKVVSKKSFNTCDESFIGYPTVNSSDYSSLKYLTCVILNMRQSTGIWSVIPKTNKSTSDKNTDLLMKRIKLMINNILLVRDDVKEKISERKKYELEHIEIISEPVDKIINEWDQFLPPLKKINIKRLANISSNFENLLLDEIKKNTDLQFAYLWELKGKMLSYSFSIQEAIQNVINSEPILLKTTNNIEFLQNACCNDDMNSVYNYFSNKESSIYRENEYIKNIDQIYNKYNNLFKPPVIISELNTRLIHPVLSDDFDEETIYLAYIKYCKFYSGDIISENLKTLCGDNKLNININQPIQEKIKIMKKNHHNYSNESLSHLIDLIHKNNSVHFMLSNIPKTPIRRFEEIIGGYPQDSGDDTELCIYEKELLELLKQLFDRFEMNYSEDTDIIVTALKDYLKEKCGEMRILVESFLNGKVRLTKILNYIDNYTIWNDFGINDYLLEDDEVGFNIYQFTSTIIHNILKVFPNMIMNNCDYSNKNVPKHWKLDKKGINSDKKDSHVSNIQNIVENEFTNNQYDFKNFQKDNILNDFLKKITNSSDNIINFLNMMPFFSKYDIDGELYKTIIDGDMLKYISKFVFLCSIVHYIDIFNSYTIENIDEETVEKLTEGGIYQHLDAKIASLLETYFFQINNYNSLIDKSASEIKQMVLKKKEKEKSKITKKFADMSEDERKTEDEMKKLKLGDWSLGLTSAVYKYNETQFRKEAEEREKDRLTEINSGIVNRFAEDIDDNHRDVLLSEYNQDREIQQRIDNDVYNMNGLGDDDDHWGDGDEEF